MKRTFRTLLTLIIAILLVVAPADAKKKVRSSRTKAKTTQTTTRKKSTSKKSSKKSTARSTTRTTTRRSTSSGGSGSPAIEYSVPETATTTVAKTKTDTRRKVVVAKPDLDEIRQSTLDPTSKFYFPKLLAKYETNDTTMTSDEFRHFYLGYMFQEDFDPYRVSPYSSVTDELRQKPTHTRQEIDTITKYALLSLQDNPFDLRQMSFLVHVLKERKKDMRAKIWEYRLEHLLGAIKSTGTGDSVENAWYVMYPSHEYDMVQLLGYEPYDAQYIEPGYDYLLVRPDESDTRKRDKSAKGFYFNVMVPQEQYELKHPEDVVAEEETIEETDDAVGDDDAPAVEEEEEEEETVNPDELPAE